jgi:methionyl-tRNA formyltransferase
MPDTALRVVFGGTPEFAAAHLQSLLNSRHHVIAVYTQPDRPAGRGRKLQASPVKQVAELAGLPVYQPATLKDAAQQQQLAALQADVMVVVAYGLILPQQVLDTPRLGCINVHGSLLPRWRGAAPVQRAIEAGDTKTGITIMQMNAGLDTGDMLATAACPIDARTNAGTLLQELAVLGPSLLLQVLDDLPAYLARRQQQDESQANYAHKILKAEALIDWCDSAAHLERKIRAFNPFPVCFSTLSGQRVRVWDASPLPAGTSATAPGTIVRADEEGIVVACGEGALSLQVLQLEGGKALPARQLLSAYQTQFAVGAQFDSRPALDS